MPGHNRRPHNVNKLSGLRCIRPAWLIEQAINPDTAARRAAVRHVACGTAEAGGVVEEMAARAQRRWCRELTSCLCMAQFGHNVDNLQALLSAAASCPYLVAAACA